MNKSVTSHSRLARMGTIAFITLLVCLRALVLVCLTACSDGGGSYRADLKEAALVDGDPRLETKTQIKSAAFNGVGNAWLIPADDGHLMITKDGGESWSRVLGDTVGGRFESIGFVNEKHGFAVNEKGEIWSTDDAGQTWVLISKLRSNRPHEWKFMSSSQIEFANDQRAWIVEVFTIWRTDDSGRNWQQIFSVLDPETQGQPQKVRFLNSKTGWLITTSKGRIYRTMDGGDTWHPVDLPKNITPTYVDFINQNTGWVCSFESVPPYTKLYRSDDGGITWSALPTMTANVLITSLTFVNAAEGWAAGRVWTGDPEASRGIVLHSLDGGQTWQQVQLGQDEPFFAQVHFVDLQHGWLFGRNSVYKTNDAGRNWNTVLKLSVSGK